MEYEALYGPEFWAVVASKQREGQRKGQAVFNTAADFFPAETRAVNSLYDPFYRDENVSPFLERLTELLTT